MENICIHHWINFKNHNPEYFVKWGKLGYEHFIYEHKNWASDSAKRLFPQYF